MSSRILYKFNEGEFRIAGRFQGHRATNADSRLIGSVSQELLLAPNLTVAENARILHRQLVGFGWRRRAGDLMLESRCDLSQPRHPPN